MIQESKGDVFSNGFFLMLYARIPKAKFNRYRGLIGKVWAALAIRKVSEEDLCSSTAPCGLVWCESDFHHSLSEFL
eukprot:IDg15168t1